MVHASIREEISSGRVSTARRVPQRVTPPWKVVLIVVDAICALAGCYIAGLPVTAGPATAIMLCGAMALCGTYRVTYAVRWYDEVYLVFVGCAVALLPVWFLLHFVTGLSTFEPILAIVVAGTLMSVLHATLHFARYGKQSVAEASAAYVTPEAQWKARHGASPVIKRAFDVTLALAGLIVTSPILLLAAVCIAIESGFPIFFRQERVGRNGALFVMYKFRTMWQDAGSDWVKRGDRRITNVGALLRQSSIDELPQLINVIRGEMSLVGPRPEMPQFAHDFQRRIRSYGDRHIVRPGLTGWAQMQCKRNLRPEDMPEIVLYDLFYVEHASPIFDAVVVVKTAAEFLIHRGV